MYLTVSILESRVQQGPSIVPRREQEREKIKNQKQKQKVAVASAKKHVAPQSSIHHTCNAHPSMDDPFLWSPSPSSNQSLKSKSRSEEKI